MNILWRILAAIGFSLFAICVIGISFCISKDIYSSADLHAYLSMRKDASPLKLALDQGILREGSSIEELLAIATPRSRQEYGRCVIYYNFDCDFDKDRASVWIVDGKMTAAYSSNWQFFDSTPPEIKTSISRIGRGRIRVGYFPHEIQELQEIEEAEMAKLKLQVENNSLPPGDH